MDFVIQWLWYLAAFAAGSGVAWVVVSGSRLFRKDNKGVAGSRRAGVER